MTAPSDFCEEWLKLYRIWELSDDNEDFLKLHDHQRECEKCRKTEEANNA